MKFTRNRIRKINQFLEKSTSRISEKIAGYLALNSPWITFIEQKLKNMKKYKKTFILKGYSTIDSGSPVLIKKMKIGNQVIKTSDLIEHSYGGNYKITVQYTPTLKRKRKAF